MNLPINIPMNAPINQPRHLPVSLRRTPAALFMAMCLASVAAFAAPESLEGRPAPDLMGRTLDGGMFKLSAQRGHPVVLNFFWVNCIPCREELPELAAEGKKYPKVRFVAAHVEDDDESVVAAFVKKLPAAPATIVLTSRRVQEIYKTFALPETHLIDRNGIVVRTLHGFTPDTAAELRRWLAAQK